MAVLQTHLPAASVVPRAAMSLMVSVAFVTTVLGVAWVESRWSIAVYFLSFWYYAVYGLACGFRAVPLPVFKRDAIVLKSVSLFALASVYLTAPLHVLSLTVVAAGFLLNIAGAAALGSDRTYYGHEIANLPALRVTRFPYSVMSHPMLVGNMTAFGGTLLNADFAQAWWPLALCHVALNLALVGMETLFTTQDARPMADKSPAIDDGRGFRHTSVVTVGIPVIVAGVMCFATAAGSAASALLVGCTALYAYALVQCYRPQDALQKQIKIQGGE